MSTPATEPRSRFLLVVTSVWLILVSAIAVIDHVALSQMTTDVRSYESEISIVQADLAKLERQLDDVAAQPASVSEARFVAAREAWDARIAQLEQAIGNAAQRDELAPMHDRLNALETRLSNLRPTRPTPASRSRSTVDATPKNPPEVLVPPFRVLGIDIRGGESFLSVAPTGADTLTQVLALRVGEAYGDWRLEKLNGTSAEFRIGSRSIKLELP